ncbi:MAG: sugar phosphate isomerase/epimerase [Chloroflexota bacterium]
MKVGLQTNVFTADMHQHHFAAILATIKATGYDGLEIGIQRVDQSKVGVFAQMVADAGLETAAIHTHFRLNQPEWVATADTYIKQAIDLTATVGATYMPMSGSRMDKTDAQLATMADMLNDFGRQAAAAGLKFCYHHHEWEFANDWHEMNFLMNNTNPAHVSILCDIGWVIKAGQSISHFIDTYGSRIAYFHVKDVPADGWFTELGKGIVPLDEFVHKLDATTPSWLVVERDAPLEHAEQSSRESRTYLQEKFNI